MGGFITDGGAWIKKDILKGAEEFSGFAGQEAEKLEAFGVESGAA